MPLSDNELFHSFVTTHDTRCPRCGYPLRALTTNVCPECGDALQLQVALVEPRIGAYLALLALCSLGLGGSLLFSLLALFAGAGLWFWESPSGYLLLAMLASSLLAFLATIILRRPLRRMRRRRQWFLALVVGVLVLGLSAIFIATFDG